MKAHEEISLEDRLLADKFCDDVFPDVKKRTIIVLGNSCVGISNVFLKHLKSTAIGNSDTPKFCVTDRLPEKITQRIAPLHTFELPKVVTIDLKPKPFYADFLNKKNKKKKK